MAKRKRSNVSGDLAELDVAKLMLEHGIAINALTASDTGWDLHCHVPDDLIVEASQAHGSKSWNLSGRAAHIQVKGGGPGNLRVGTVRGWLTGSASGVPTFMFWQRRNKPVFSTPADFEAWIDDLPMTINDESKYPANSDRTTQKGALMRSHPYDPKRFPSVLRMWTDLPMLSMTFRRFTGWMNHDDTEDQLADIVLDVAVTVWADKGYGEANLQDLSLVSELGDLYAAAGYIDYEQRASETMKGADINLHTVGDHLFTRDSIDPAIAHQINSQKPAESAHRLLSTLSTLNNEDAKPVL